jgi:hypothetical protein
MRIIGFSAVTVSGYQSYPDHTGHLISEEGEQCRDFSQAKDHIQQAEHERLVCAMEVKPAHWIGGQRVTSNIPQKVNYKVCTRANSVTLNSKAILGHAHMFIAA